MDEFRDSIARITIDGAEVRGTGFLVAPDLVATALHVVANRDDDPPSFPPGAIQLHFPGIDPPIKAVVQAVNRDADCALLRCVDAKPLATRPTLVLRELSYPGDVFTSFGYPDTQFVDGMVWSGKIRDPNAQLTNFFPKGQVPYRPVLQLFSQEAAAPGAAPQGLSGAPVIVGAAVVGLMRFALMRAGTSAAGTLYACSAADIVALAPTILSLRPGPAQTVIITPAQIEKLLPLLDVAFASDLTSLRRVVRFSLGAEAERSLPAARSLTEYATGLLEILQQQGPGTIGVLLRGVLAARPTNELKAFASDISPYALEPVDDHTQVQDTHDDCLADTIGIALTELTVLRDRAEFQSIIRSYRADFERTRQQISILAKYKELHSCLHDVQEKFEQISETVNRMKDGEAVNSYVRDHVRFLHAAVTTATSQLAGLPTADRERVWIQELDDCAAILKSVIFPQAEDPVDDSKLFGVPDRLEQTLSAATELNRDLVETAKFVRLDNLGDTMRLVEQQLGDVLQPDALQRLKDGYVAVGRLRARLSGLVAEHDEWQELNTALEAARNERTKHQPQAKFTSWKLFRNQLVGLCGTFPSELWAADLTAMMKPWMADTPPPEPRLATSAEKLDNQFVDFYKTCVDRFIDVDDELNRLCRRIVPFGLPLTVLTKLRQQPTQAAGQG
ncbi:hypothetical protein S58_35010 [Bradyrhizobium oligotrophicum S58]|uniref:Serine protease n=1 Tax=Bradyrhizobium oligotrophicum S58 TaxID=1245469 RepID=M4Z7H6_9BRAD|nr:MULTISPECIES: serine protease [Bradyrhizobium]BAM89494.1 hypothetical protein S58_35010 [Bradyrhizobium oligotrophicum S58]